MHITSSWSLIDPCAKHIVVQHVHSYEYLPKVVMYHSYYSVQDLRSMNCSSTSIPSLPPASNISERYEMGHYAIVHFSMPMRTMSLIEHCVRLLQACQFPGMIVSMYIAGSIISPVRAG